MSSNQTLSGFDPLGNKEGKGKNTDVKRQKKKKDRGMDRYVIK